jgi:1,4-dihydroxy-2-naphthoyl-CoA synthase
MELGLLAVGVGDELILDVLVDQGTEAFCSGGDQALRDSDGYVDFDSFGRLKRSRSPGQTHLFDTFMHE